MVHQEAAEENYEQEEEDPKDEQPGRATEPTVATENAIKLSDFNRTEKAKHGRELPGSDSLDQSSRPRSGRSHYQREAR